MGLSSSSTTTGPSKQALPQLNYASDQLRSVYGANQGNLSNISGGLSNAFAQYQLDDPTLGAARGRVQDVLGGKYLSGNPELQGIIDQTSNSVSDRVNAIFSRAGQTGSSRQIGELGKQLSEAEGRLRYQNYSDEQSRMDGAVGQALGLNQARNNNYATYTGLGQAAATTPYIGANYLAQGLGGLWGNSTTTTQSPNLFSQLLQAASNGAQAAALSDRRTKENISHVATDGDGLKWYDFNYIGDPEPQRGVMADEVAIFRPWALGPVVNGFSTVNYEVL